MAGLLPQQSFVDAVLAAYRTHRTESGVSADEYVMRRAALSAEFSLAQWLVRGRAEQNDDMVAEAKALLEKLAADIDTYGGREISATPLEGEDEGPAGRMDSQPVARARSAATVAGFGSRRTTASKPSSQTPTHTASLPTRPRSTRTTTNTPMMLSPPTRWHLFGPGTDEPSMRIPH
ncbi:hypothetical protein [Nesterenkonia pannonica]|uniref:hypothetical protein n=1 Tax=Nesterenkonia pannonica TaxID=1548602 RepID=UPI0021644EFA|nr:hypothetical protein [Nesterenkonia pannonica]